MLRINPVAMCAYPRMLRSSAAYATPLEDRRSRMNISARALYVQAVTRPRDSGGAVYPASVRELDDVTYD